MTFDRINTKYYFIFSFVVYAILLNIFYYKTRGAGFVFDMTEWLYDYERHPNFDFFNPPFDKNLRPVYHFLLYSTYKYFGVKASAWYALSTGLYYGVVVSFHIFLCNFYRVFNIERYKELTFITCLAMVLCPFGTEIVVWNATIHYSIVFICLFTSCSLILYNKGNIYGRATIFLVLFLISILSIELSYSIIPITFLSFILLYYFKKTSLTIRQYVSYFLLPQVVIFVCYNFICWKFYDKFLGHYNIGKVDFGVVHLIIHYIKLTAKHLLFVNYFGQNVYEAFYNGIDKYAILIIIAFILLLLYTIYYFVVHYKNLSYSQGIIAFFFLSSISLYIPISFLFFHNWKEIELDRLGYGTMLFALTALFYIIWEVRNYFIKFSFYFLFIGFSVLLLQEYSVRWEKSAIVRKSFSNNLPVYKDKNVYLVAAPILMKYAYLITINDSMELHRHLRIFKKQALSNDYRILGFYNMIDIDDLISVTKLNDTSITVRVEKWGAWCWYNLKSSIQRVETEKYTIVPDNDNLGYKIYFKSIDSNDKLLLFNKLQFKEIDLSTKEVGYVFI